MQRLLARTAPQALLKFLLAQPHSGLLRLRLVIFVITALKASMKSMMGLIGRFFHHRHIHISLSILLSQAAEAAVVSAAEAVVRADI
jgi:hypothetical protein